MKLRVGFLQVVGCCVVLSWFGSLDAFAQDGKGWQEGRPRMQGRGQRHGEGFREAFQKALEKLKVDKPAEYERLMELKKTDMKAFWAEVRKLIPHRGIPNRVMQLDRECFKLGKEYHRARTEEERAAIKAELTKKLEEATDAMLADWKKRMEWMQTRLEEMEKNRDALIQKRLDMLLNGRKKEGGKGPMGPPPPAGAGGPPPPPAGADGPLPPPAAK